MAELENARQENFAKYMAQGMKQIEAYRAAFPSSQKWKDKTVSNRASELYNTGEVLGRIRELQTMSTSSAVMSATERKEWLTKIIIDEEGKHNTGDRLKAVDILNKMDGDYTEKLQVNGTLNNPFAGMTTEELREIVGNE